MSVFLTVLNRITDGDPDKLAVIQKWAGSLLPAGTYKFKIDSIEELPDGSVNVNAVIA